MQPTEERRRQDRKSFDPPLIGIVNDCEGGTVVKERRGCPWGFVFVDVPNLSRSGALIASSFQIEEGSLVDFQVCAPGEQEWKSYKATVAWSGERDEEGLYKSGLDFSAPHDASWCPRLQPGEVEFLINTQLLQAIPRNALLHLLNCLNRQPVLSGQCFISQGEAGDALYIIQSGTCVVTVVKDGESHQVARLKSGDLVGEMAVLTGEPRSANVIAETDMVVWRLDKEAFDHVAAEHSDLRIFLTELVTNRFETSPVTADRTVGKYVIKNKIGQGGWSLVYEGRHKILDMPVAIKMLKHDMAMEASFQERFRQEANIIAQLIHPHIVKVYDIDELYQTAFIIMEYLEGESLRSLLNRMGCLPHALTVKFLVQVAEGLAYAHDKGIVHQDIKPANLFIVPTEHIKILDFGLACSPGSEDLNIAGTVFYASPEQIEGDPVDLRTDVYAMGIMAYEMAAGCRPFPEDDLAELMDRHVEEEIPDPLIAVPDMPPSLARFIRTACRRGMQDRYQSMGEVLVDLKEALRETGQSIEQAAGFHTRKMASLLLFYDEDLQKAVTGLLEEFSQKAIKQGIDIKTAEFRDL